MHLLMFKLNVSDVIEYTLLVLVLSWIANIMLIRDGE